MASRRINRGNNPVMLTTMDQEIYVVALRTNPEIRAAVETLLGKTLDEMTHGEQLTAFCNFLELGRSSAAASTAARGIQDLLRTAEAIRGDVSLADRVVVLENRNQLLTEQLARYRAQEDRPT